MLRHAEPVSSVLLDEGLELRRGPLARRHVPFPGTVAAIECRSQVNTPECVKAATHDGISVRLVGWKVMVFPDVVIGHEGSAPLRAAPFQRVPEAVFVEQFFLSEADRMERGMLE